MFVYLICNVINGMQYVGTTVQTVRGRVSEHRAKARNGFPQPLYMAMRADGVDNFTVNVLHETSDYEDMLLHEQRYIKALGTLHPGGYNLVRGGRGNYGWRVKEETRERMRQAARKRPPQTEEHRRKSGEGVRAYIAAHPEYLEKLRVAGRGRKRGPPTEETKIKMRLAHQNRSPLVRLHMAEAQRGKVQSPETRAKNSDSVRAHHAKHPEHLAKARAAYREKREAFRLAMAQPTLPLLM